MALGKFSFALKWGVVLFGCGLVACKPVPDDLVGRSLDVPPGCTETRHAGEIDAQSDADLEALRGVTHLEGGLVIGAGVTDVASLECLTSVRRLQVVGATLAKFRLDGLRQIDDGLDVVNNSALVSIELPELATVGGTLSVAEGPTLEVVALPALASVGHLNGASMDFSALPKLRELDFAALPEIPAGLSIGNVGTEQKATLVLKFGSVTKIVGGLRLAGVANLGSADGLAGLVELGADLIVLNNSALVSIELPELATVGGTLSVAEGPTLEVVALPALASVGHLNGASMDFSALPKLRELDFAALPEIPAGLSIGNVGTEQKATLVLKFGSVTKIVGGLRLGGISNLRELTGFTALSSVGDLSILNNAELPTCEATTLATQANAPAPAISGNLADNCGS